MARRRKVTGTCHLCGDFEPLSYEHVPPEAAFNNRPVVAHLIDEVLEKGSWQESKGKILQRGAGAYTLCNRCNPKTGAWYGRWFVEWVYQGMNILWATTQSPTLYYTFHIFPLRVLKQIICMFFSANGPEFRKVHPDLERFVLDKERRYLPSGVKFYAFYSVGKFARQAGVMHRFDLYHSSKSTTFSEITYPPFGYVMSFDNPPHPGLQDLTHFARYNYNTFRSISLRIPALPVISYFPGDYRSQKEIDRDFRENIQINRQR